MTGALAAVLQLADGTLPVGRYVHSHGMESWLRSSPEAPAEVIIEVAWSGVAAVATLDAVVLRCCLQAQDAAEVIRLDQLLLSHKCVSGARTASQAIGRQLAALELQIGPEDEVSSAYFSALKAGTTPGNIAAVEGRLLAGAGASAEDAVTAVLYSATAGFLSVAVRLGRIGPRAVQQALWQGRGHLQQLVADSLATELDDIHASALVLEIHLMSQANLEHRLFRT